MKKWLILLCLLLSLSIFLGAKGESFYLKGAFYQDWMALKTEGIDLYSRLSSRLKLTFWNKPGTGWTAYVDIRNRATLGDGGSNQFIIYDAHVDYNKLRGKLFFSLGQMNLYGTAGIGELTGALAGYRLTDYISMGAYAGLDPDIYNTEWDTEYTKFGFFLRYLGPGAKQVSLSINRLSFDGKMERQYLYANLLYPYKRLFVLYGNLEYELDKKITSEDRLSRMFLNTRINITRYADITANYSSGRGLDYHQFLLQQSQDPTLVNNEVERYFYNEMYGVRLSLKPIKNLRIYVARRESEQKDREIVNHTTRFGLSLIDILRTGISFYGNVNVNRGDASESDSFYLSASKNFGKLSWGLRFSNYYNAIRFSGQGTPEVIHIPDRQTLSTNLFLVLSRSLALSLDYAYSFRDTEGENEHQLFIRAIYRR